MQLYSLKFFKKYLKFIYNMFSSICYESLFNLGHMHGLFMEGNTEYLYCFLPCYCLVPQLFVVLLYLTY